MGFGVHAGNLADSSCVFIIDVESDGSRARILIEK